MRYYEWILHKGREMDNVELTKKVGARVIGTAQGFEHRVGCKGVITAENFVVWDGESLGDFVLPHEIKEITRESKDNVSSPSHYNQHGVECIEAIRASLGNEFGGYCKGNVMKYLWRYKYKNGVEDLKKARVYLDWLIEAEEERDG